MGICPSGEQNSELLELNVPPYQKKGHRILTDDPDEVYDAVMVAVRKAETIKRAPVYGLDILKCL